MFVYTAYSSVLGLCFKNILVNTETLLTAHVNQKQWDREVELLMGQKLRDERKRLDQTCFDALNNFMGYSIENNST